MIKIWLSISRFLALWIDWSFSVLLFCVISLARSKTKLSAVLGVKAWFVSLSLPDATSNRDVTTSFDSRDLLPRRWLLHFVHDMDEICSNIVFNFKLMRDNIPNTALLYGSTIRKSRQHWYVTFVYAWKIPDQGRWMWITLSTYHEYRCAMLSICVEYLLSVLSAHTPRWVCATHHTELADKSPTSSW